MSRTDSLRNDLVRLAKKEADLHKDLARHQSDAHKHASEASKKLKFASGTRSLSSANSYLKQARDYEKKAADAEKKVADAKKKIADVAHQKVSKQKALETAEKADRTAISKAAEQERRKDTSHVRMMSILQRPLAIIPPKREPLRVLYLTTNPDMLSGGGLRTDAEVRMVQQALRGSKYRDRVEVSYLPAATREDLMQGMNDKRPHVIHFSGHGGGKGIQFDNGSVDRPVGFVMDFAILARCLAATDETPKLLVLNACDTLEGAEVLLASVPVVIAMSESITDIAAANFATAFYAAIASAQSVGKALEQAKLALEFLPSGEGDLPECVARDDVDVDQLVLVTPD